MLATTLPASVMSARLDENARPQQSRAAAHVPQSPKPSSGEPSTGKPGFKGNQSRRPRPASAGPRARIQSARNASVDDRLEAIQTKLNQTAAACLTVTAPPPPPGAHPGTGSRAIEMKGSSVPTGHQLLEQLEILRQANAYMRQQQQAAMLRLASATQLNEALEARAAHAEKLVQALSLANKRSHAQLTAVTRELREADGSEARAEAEARRDVSRAAADSRAGAASQAVAALAGALTPAQAHELIHSIVGQTAATTLASTSVIPPAAAEPSAAVVAAGIVEQLVSRTDNVAAAAAASASIMATVTGGGAGAEAAAGGGGIPLTYGYAGICEGEMMAGRSKPAPLRMAEIERVGSDPALDSSPVGAALMARKAAAAGAAGSPVGTALMARKAEVAEGKAGRVGAAIAHAALEGSGAAGAAAAAPAIPAAKPVVRAIAVVGSPAASPARKAVAIASPARSPRGPASPSTLAATGVAARAVATGAAAAMATSPARPAAKASKAAMEAAKAAVDAATTHAASKQGTRMADEARPIAAGIVEQLVSRAVKSPARRAPVVDAMAAAGVDPKAMVATILQGATVGPDGSADGAKRKDEAKNFATNFVTNLLKEIPGGTAAPVAVATPPP